MMGSNTVKFLLLAGLAATLLALDGCDNPAAMNQSTANVKHVSQVDFADEVTACPTPVVVDFYATWCAPCRDMAALIEHVAADYAGKIKFVKVNVDESPGLAQNYEVQPIPNTVMFKDGKLVDRVIGVPAQADFKAKLDALVTAK